MPNVVIIGSRRWLWCTVVLLSGCFGTLKTGGAPPISFDVDADIARLAAQFESATNIADFYKAPSAAARDAFVTGRLVLIDLRYLQFIRSLTADKQQLDSATDLANLTLNLAGTLVGGVRAKTNLAAAAAGLGGAKTSIEKNFYYERSVDALVATMNAKRKEMLAQMLRAMGSDLAGYGFTQAVTDTHDYYLAGTINGALSFISAQAGEQERAADKKLQGLQVVRENALLPLDDRAAKRQLTLSIGARELSLAAANRALAALGVSADRLPAELAASQQMLQDFVREARTPRQIGEARAAFESAGIFKAQ